MFDSLLFFLILLCNYIGRFPSWMIPEHVQNDGGMARGDKPLKFVEPFLQEAPVDIGIQMLVLVGE